MRVYVLAFLMSMVLLMATPPAIAEDASCECDRYRDLVFLQNLGNDLSEIGTRALHSEGREFEIRREELETLKLRITSNKLIPEHCRRLFLKQLHKPGYTLEVRVVQSGRGITRLGDHHDAEELVLYYEDFYDKKYRRKDCDRLDSLECRAKMGAEDYARFDADMKANPNLLKDGIRMRFDGRLSDEEQKMLRAYHEYLNSPNEAEYFAKIASKKDGLDDDQFARLVQLVGERKLRSYDENRRDGKGPTAKGVVTSQQLIDGNRFNTAVFPGLTDKSEFYGSEGQFGVCRDIADHQVAMLKTRGFPHAYVMVYQDATGYHAAAVAMRPGKGDTLLYDYGNLDVKRGKDGSQLLHRGSRDASLSYELYHQGGSKAANIPSEMQKFLAGAVGLDPTKLDPLARTSSSMIAADVRLPTPSNVHANARVVAGEDSVGNKYLGAAATVNYLPQSNAPGTVGLFAGNQIRRGDHYTNYQTQNMLITYLQAEQHVRSNKVAVGKDTTVRVDGFATWSAAATKSIDGENRDVELQEGLRLNAEAQIEKGSPKSPIQLYAKAGVQSGFSAVDFRGDYLPIIGLPVLHHVYANGRIIGRVGEDGRVFVDATAVVDQLGQRARIEGGYVTKNWGVTGNMSGALTEQTAKYQDHSMREVGASLIFRPIPAIKAGVSAQVPIEGDDIMKRTRLMGGVEIVTNK